MSEGLEGFEEGLRKMDALQSVGTAKMEQVLEYILIQMCNYAKLNKHPSPGSFKDHTANLRNSIGINFTHMKSWEASEAEIAELKALKHEMETPVFEYEGDKVWGYLYAGMDYAIHLERLEGYWVLTGAIDFFEPKLNEMFRKQLRFVRSDLI